MIEQLKVYRSFIVAGVAGLIAVSLYFYISGLKSNITKLEAKVSKTQLELANTKLESERFKNAVEEQNAKIQNLKVSKEESDAKLAKWKALPPKIKYKTITKIREVKSDECKDIKNALDAVKLINPNIL